MEELPRFLLFERVQDFLKPFSISFIKLLITSTIKQEWHPHKDLLHCQKQGRAGRWRNLPALPVSCLRAPLLSLAGEVYPAATKHLAQRSTLTAVRVSSSSVYRLLMKITTLAGLGKLSASNSNGLCFCTDVHSLIISFTLAWLVETGRPRNSAGTAVRTGAPCLILYA